MSHAPTPLPATSPASEQDAPPATATDHGFGAEYRDQARQRRFVRSGDAESAPAAARPATAPAARPGATQPTARPVAAPAAAPAHAPAPSAPQWQPSMPTDHVPPVAAAALRRPVAPQTSTVTRTQRDERGTVAELVRMSEQLGDVRQQLGAMTMRAERAEAEVAASQQRMMAARSLVHDAQEATRASADRCARLEARCDTLHEALEVAVNATFIERWRWRRERRARLRTHAHVLD